MRALWTLGLGTMIAFAAAEACDSSTRSEQCNELTETALTETAYAVAEAGTDNACTTSSDCVVASSSTSCVPGCGAVLSTAGQAKLNAATAETNSTVCAEFASDNCPANAAPPCPALVAACVQGVCVVPDGGEDSGAMLGEDAGPLDAGETVDASDAESAVDASLDARTDASIIDAAEDAHDAGSAGGD